MDEEILDLKVRVEQLKAALREGQELLWRFSADPETASEWRPLSVREWTERVEALLADSAAEVGTDQP